jgi:hypothetical protein
MKQQKEIAGSPSRLGFANLLESMRVVEDVSWFVIEGGEQDGTRIPMIDDEVLVGWDRSGGRLAWDRAEIGALGLSVFKDWSGIEAEPAGESEFFINGQATKERVRLRHGDRLKLKAARAKDAEAAGPASPDIHLLFEEPVSLSILDSLLPQEAPADAPVIEKPREESAENNRSEEPSPIPNPSDRPTIVETLRGSKKYLGYFSPAELWLVMLGTPVLTLLLFLALLLITQVIE